MTHAFDLVAWSGMNLSMEEFVDRVRMNLPVLAIATSGYAGCDEYIHEVSTNEICWIYNIQRQMRIVAKSGPSEYLSIPIDFDTKFEVRGKKIKGSVTAQQLLDILKDIGEPFYARFDQDQKVRYQKGAASLSVAQFGEFEVIDSYEEKYLLTYTVSAGNVGVIYSNTVPIPVYIPITMDIAAGFKYGTEKQFRTWCTEIKNITGNFRNTPAKSNELIIFSQKPSSGVYEYLIPSLFVSKEESDTPKKHDADPISTSKNNYVVLTRQDSNKLPTPPPQLVPKQQFVVHKPGRKPNNDPHHHPQGYPLPPMPRRTVPPIPSDGVDITPALVPNRLISSSDAGIPSVPVSLQNIGAVSLSSYHRASSHTGKPAPPTPVSPPTPVTSPLHNYEKLPTYEKVECSVESHPSSIQPKREISSYENISDIPVDLEIKLLTKADVSHILHLMKLDRYSDKFDENDVDGLLLATLSESDLISEFKLERMPARRLSMFIHEKWRPK